MANLFTNKLVYQVAVQMFILTEMNVVIRNATTIEQKENHIAINISVLKMAVIIQLVYYKTIVTNTTALMALVRHHNIKRLEVHIVKDITLIIIKQYDVVSVFFEKIIMWQSILYWLLKT